MKKKLLMVVMTAFIGMFVLGGCDGESNEEKGQGTQIEDIANGESGTTDSEKVSEEEKITTNSEDTNEKESVKNDYSDLYFMGSDEEIVSVKGIDYDGFCTRPDNEFGYIYFYAPDTKLINDGNVNYQFLVNRRTGKFGIAVDSCSFDAYESGKDYYDENILTTLAGYSIIPYNFDYNVIKEEGEVVTYNGLEMYRFTLHIIENDPDIENKKYDFRDAAYVEGYSFQINGGGAMIFSWLGDKALAENEEYQKKVAHNLEVLMKGFSYEIK